MSMSVRPLLLAAAAMLLSHALLAAPATTVPANEIAHEAFRHAPAWIDDQTVYEVNFRQFSPEGTIEGLRKGLPRLKAMGVGTLWLMPIHPIGVEGRTGKLGSPYAVRDYLQVNPEFGTLEQFKSFVDEAHRLGLYVIMDWVAPHTALDHPWVRQHPDWYNRDAQNHLVPPVPAWRDVAGLNYRVPELRKAMIDAMSFWVRDVGVDGFRCDSAEFVPLDFWREARVALRRIKPVWLLAEGNKPELMEDAFDAAYAWDLPVNLEGIVKGTKSVEDLRNYLRADAKAIPAGGRRLNYTSNHDKNAFEGTTHEQLQAAAPACAVLSFTLPGVPMVYNGQESAAEHRLNLFERDPIVWEAGPLERLYATLSRLKRDNLALRESAAGAPIQFIETSDAHVLSFKRVGQTDRVLVVINFSGAPVRIPTPSDARGMILCVSDQPDADRDAERSKPELAIAPWGYRVWRNP